MPSEKTNALLAKLNVWSIVSKESLKISLESKELPGFIFDSRDKNLLNSMAQGVRQFTTHSGAPTVWTLNDANGSFLCFRLNISNKDMRTICKDVGLNIDEIIQEIKNEDANRDKSRSSSNPPAPSLFSSKK